ncbi:hypothetical protein TNCV_4114901 [Trichonephila clavipes]|nr:hypothetical protein TNCV_4114901 [Trichonephila clavipes]
MLPMSFVFSISMNSTPAGIKTLNDVGVVVVVRFILIYLEKTRDRRTETYSTITEEYRLFVTNDDPRIEQKCCSVFHLRREPITRECPTSFLEDTSGVVSK